MEFLLLNHPLDCPVCDKGGECPLQNQAMSVGRPESRFDGTKREFEKPINVSAQVLLDRERCVSCARCTRFAEQIAGRPDDRAARARRQAAGRHCGGRALRLVLLRQHGADLPGGRAHERLVPVPVPPVRPRLGPDDVRALRGRVLAAHRLPPRSRHPSPRMGRPRRQRGVELRQGSLRVRLPDAGAARVADDPGERRAAGRVVARGHRRRRARARRRRVAAPGSSSAAAAPSRTPTPTPGSRAWHWPPTASTSGRGRRRTRRPPSSPRAWPAPRSTSRTTTLETAPVVLLVALRARGRVAHRVPAAAQGGPCGNQRGVGRRGHDHGAGEDVRPARARSARRRGRGPRRPRPRDPGAARAARRGDPRRRAHRGSPPAPPSAAVALAEARPVPHSPGCRVARGSAARSTPEPSPACCPAVVRSPTPGPHAGRGRLGRRADALPGRDRTVRARRSSTPRATVGSPDAGRRGVELGGLRRSGPRPRGG